MKKILFCAFIIMSLLFSMASCNASNSNVPDDTDETIEEGGSSEGGEETEDSGESESDPETDGEGSQEGDDDTEDEPEVSYVYSINSKKYHLPGCRFVASMNEESKVVFEGTLEELSSRGYLPCKTCKPDPDYDYDSKDNSNSGSGNGFIDVDSGYTYATNPSSMKFHYSGCSAVKNTNDENKVFTNASRSELVRQGYVPCGICKP